MLAAVPQVDTDVPRIPEGLTPDTVAKPTVLPERPVVAGIGESVPVPVFNEAQANPMELLPAAQPTPTPPLNLSNAPNVAVPVFTPTVEQPVQPVAPTVAVPVITPQDEPKPVQTPVAVPQISALQRLQNEQNELASKDYSKPIYAKDGTLIKPAGKDRDSKWSTVEKVLSFIEGWATGGLAQGIKNSTNRNFNEQKNDLNRMQAIAPLIQQAQQAEKFNTGLKQEQVQTDLYNTQIADIKRRPERDKNAVIAKVELEILKSQNRKKEREASEEFKRGEYEEVADESGKVWKVFKKDPNRQREPVINPETKQQEVDPSKIFYEYFDPVTQQTVRGSGNTIISNSGTILSGDANRKQQVNIKNVDNRMEVDRENVKNHLAWQSNVSSVLSTLLANDANLTALGGNVSGLRASMDAQMTEAKGLLEQMAKYNLDPQTATDDEIKKANAEKQKLQTRYNELADDFNKSNVKLYEELGKTEAGKQKAEQLKKLIPQAPPKLTYTPIEAVQVQSQPVNTGKKVPKERDPLGLFQ